MQKLTERNTQLENMQMLSSPSVFSWLNMLSKLHWHMQGEQTFLWTPQQSLKGCPPCSCSLSTHHSHHPELPLSFTPGSRPTPFPNLSHHRLPSSLRTDSTDFTTGLFLLSISVFYGRPMEQGRPLYFFPVVSFLLSSFFPRLIWVVGDWMSNILPHMVWP